MRLMIASDLHGSYTAACQMKVAFEKEQAERLVLLGDLLYHGPRNDLPEGYHPKAVIQLLNEMKDKIFCVRGNCEAEVDQMVLEFPVLADYAIMYEAGKVFFFTHGHVYNKTNMPPLQKGDLLIHGHTHIFAMEQVGDNWYLNPGSVSIPKGGNPATYMIYEDGAFTLCKMNGERIKTFHV